MPTAGNIECVIYYIMNITLGVIMYLRLLLFIYSDILLYFLLYHRDRSFYKATSIVTVYINKE